jgi:hypothetical protein
MIEDSGEPTFLSFFKDMGELVRARNVFFIPFYGAFRRPLSWTPAQKAIDLAAAAGDDAPRGVEVAARFGIRRLLVQRPLAMTLRWR